MGGWLHTKMVYLPVNFHSISRLRCGHERQRADLFDDCELHGVIIVNSECV